MTQDFSWQDVAMQREDEINSLNAKIAELEARLRWIPLSEQLPEDSDRLILSLEFGKIPHISWARCVRNNPQIFSHWREIGELPEVGG